MSQIPTSFCSMATENCATELIGLLLSLSVHHEGTSIICLVDETTQKSVETLSVPLKIKIEFHQILNEYSGKDRKQMEREGIWSTFQMMKSSAIDIALKTFSDTMFLDSDILVTSPIFVDKTKQLGLSPHYIRKSDTDKFGYYNGGALWTSDKSVPEAWREFTKTSRFYDQASIENLATKYSHFEFGEECNVSWWRLFQSEESANKIGSYFSTRPSLILYKSNPIRFVHTHFTKNPTDLAVSQFNTYIMNLLKTAGMYKELTIIGRIMNKKWTIHIPKQPMPSPWNHTNDSFREELIIMYSKYKHDLELVYDDTKNLLLEPAVMLYDRDTINWFTNENIPFLTKVYLGNCDIETDGQVIKKTGLNVSPWIYWPRKPMIVETLLKKGEGSLGFSDRPIESLFIGNFENAVQQTHRTSQDWSKSVSEFHLTGGTQHKFSPKDYLLKLAQARFGLCLRGYGVKCHREVELMAFGTVPIVTPNVNTTSYLEPLIEGVHYIRVSTPEQIPETVRSISPEQWLRMSNACKDWYMRNIHSDNMWKTFMGHLLYQA